MVQPTLQVLFLLVEYDIVGVGLHLVLGDVEAGQGVQVGAPILLGTLLLQRPEGRIRSQGIVVLLVGGSLVLWWRRRMLLLVLGL